MTDDKKTWLVFGIHLWFVYACVFTCWILACLFMVDLVPSYMFLIGIDG